MEELLIEYLKNGLTQHEIADIFKKDGITPNSLSSVEKHLKVIRAKYGAKTMFHFGYILGKE